MAVLSDADRQELWSDYMRTFPHGETCGVAKADLRAAVNAIDQWVSDNAASLNAAIPQPARGQLTAAQKARLLTAVVTKRFVKGV